MRVGSQPLAESIPTDRAKAGPELGPIYCRDHPVFPLAITSFLDADGRFLRMSGVQNRIIRQREYPPDDALCNVLPIAAGILIISDTALEDRVAHKGDAVFFDVIDHGVRGMAGGMDDSQKKSELASKEIISPSRRYSTFFIVQFPTQKAERFMRGFSR